MGDHDHQPVLRHLLEEVHDLDAGGAVQGAGGLVGQQDIRVVHQGPGDGHALHLAAGHLIGLFVKLVPQAHPLQGPDGPLPPLGLADAGDGQGQLHVCQHSLVGDQVVALEDEADGMVPVGIPVPVLIFFRGNSVDDQVAGVVAVQAADDI